MFNCLTFLRYIFIALFLVSCDSSDNSNTELQDGIVFLANKDTYQTFELYLTNHRGDYIQRLNHALAENATVNDFVVSPDGKYVAYSATSGPLTPIELYIANMDGSGTYKVSEIFPSNPPAYSGVSQYSWSPESTHLAYLANHQGGNPDKSLYIAPVSNGPSINVTPQASVDSFRWSPNNGHIAYLGYKLNLSNSLGIYVVEINGQIETKVSGDLAINETVYNDGYTWAPDSSRLAYIKRNSSSIDEMHTVLPDGTGSYNLSNGINAIPQYWLWAPDSSRLAYIADQDTTSVYELYTILPDASDNRKISVLQDLDDDVNVFSWSPDSSYIAYQAGRPSNNVELYTVAPKGDQHTKVSGLLGDNEEVVSFFWAPNSSQIAYWKHSGATNIIELFIVEPNGGNLASIFNRDNSNYSYVSNAHWSPDSNHIAFQASVQTELKLYALNIKDQIAFQVSQEPNISGGSVKLEGFKWTSDSKNLVYKATFNHLIYEELFSASIDGSLQKNISGTMVFGGHVDNFEITQIQN